MRIFVNKENRQLFLTLASVMAALILASQGMEYLTGQKFSFPLLLLSLAAAVGILAGCFRYFAGQERILENAVSQIGAFLAGDADARIPCDEEGELYRLFHEVNTLSAVLNAHAAKENQGREFLKHTMSDISHQLKTPLTALNIYYDLIREEAEELPEIREFVELSGKELGRIETLVQNLLKITRLDAGAIVIEKHRENIADMMKDIELRFTYRARQEQKTFALSGSDSVSLLCDRDWLTEAVENLVKNAFDHTGSGDTIRIEWQQSASMLRIAVKDSGSGIHPEDLHHIFKRFYRSRFSKDTQGAGLGLPLAKAVIEAHDGTIEAHSEPGQGASFVMYFPVSSECSSTARRRCSRVHRL